MEPGDIRIQIRMGGLDPEDLDQIEIFGKLWSGPYAEQIHAWLDYCMRFKPGESKSEIMFQALILGMANMTANFEQIEKQESLRTAQTHEREKRAKGWDDYKRGRPVVKMLRTGEKETERIEAGEQEDIFVAVKGGLDTLREQLDLDEANLQKGLMELKQRLEGTEQ